MSEDKLREADIDNYMKSFLKTFFERGGTGPGAVLAIKQRLTPEAKDSIRDKFKRQFGGSAGSHELLALDQAEATYTPLRWPSHRSLTQLPQLRLPRKDQVNGS